jgi:two-component system cell cycle response regulator
LSVCLSDIDHFKQVNDHGGHAMGDRVLSTFAQLVREELPNRGAAGRLGGDEFCFVLPGFDASQAGHAMERMRTRLESMLFAQRDGAPIRVTATFGIAELTSAHHDEAALLDVADHALYEGKRDGRNRVSNAVGAWRKLG